MSPLDQDQADVAAWHRNNRIEMAMGWALLVACMVGLWVTS